MHSLDATSLSSTSYKLFEQLGALIHDIGGMGRRCTVEWDTAGSVALEKLMCHTVGIDSDAYYEIDKI